MKVVVWRGGIGYGDIISPISYVHNLSRYSGEKVVLRMEWINGNDHRYASDSEPLWKTADYIFSIAEKSGTDVELIHLFNIDSGMRLMNYSEDLMYKDQLNNYWHASSEYCTTRSDKSKSLNIAINTTRRNRERPGEYNGGTLELKFPELSWMELILKLQDDGHHVTHVDYRTQTEEAVSILKTTDLFIGYHGSTTWLAKYCKTPSVVFTTYKWEILTNVSFRYSVILKSLSEFSVDKCLPKSRNLVEWYEEDMLERVFDEEVYKKYAWKKYTVKESDKEKYKKFNEEYPDFYRL